MLATPDVLQRFATHYRTGEPIPAELIERIERFTSGEQESTDMSTMANSQTRDIEAALAALPPRDAKVLRLYFGLDDGNSRTLEEIGRIKAGFEAELNAFGEAKGVSPGVLIHALRLSTTGQAVGPGVYDCLVLVGRAKSLERIAALPGVTSVTAAGALPPAAAPSRTR